MVSSSPFRAPISPMAAAAELQSAVHLFGHPSLKRFSRAHRKQRLRPNPHRDPATLGGVSFLSPLICRHGMSPTPCRAVRSEDAVDSSSGDGEKKTDLAAEVTGSLPPKRKGALYSLKSLIIKVSGSRSWPKGQYRKAVERAEDLFFSSATQFGRYIFTMLSTGVILAIGFQLSGGDSQMNTLIWYSWLGGIIIGTMIGANLVLEEHSRAGPRNVVITGSTRGLGKALAREFLLSGDRVVVASRSPESVHMTIEELEENLKEGISMAGDKSRRKFSHAKIVGVACDVCIPDDVKKLANFAVDELGSIDIWVNGGVRLAWISWELSQSLNT